MKLYTNLVPVLKGNCMPFIQPTGVIEDEDKLEFVEVGTVFKVKFIDNIYVYLVSKDITYIMSPKMVDEFFKESEVDVWQTK